MPLIERATIFVLSLSLALAACAEKRDAPLESDMPTKKEMPREEPGGGAGGGAM